jgi:peptide-methionine (S)-S-oxide reductase
METAVFGGGCFWCTEAIFQSLKGVSSVLPGYAGGHVANPTYEQVSAGDTGHAEVTKIDFDPAIISFSDLLGVFFGTHDPTTMNRQGHDVGTQYRSVVFYTSPEQKAAAEKAMSDLEKEKVYEGAIVTEVKPLDKFYEAENYHQNYFKNNPGQPYCQAVISPKVAKFRAKFSGLIKN